MISLPLSTFLPLALGFLGLGTGHSTLGSHERYLSTAVLLDLGAGCNLPK
jgi:hypothetical protein